MKVSVALCTYNGEAFLAQQLASIGNQTRPIDELVIRDDGSSDATLEIAHEFCGRQNFRCRIIRGDKNLGSTKNFEACLLQCQGDVVLLSDQDDVWAKNKVERIVSGFSDPDVGVVFSNARMVDEHGSPIGYSLWDAIRFGDHEKTQIRSKQAFPLLLRRYVVTGATMAVKRRLVDFTAPFSPDLIHDAWLIMVLSTISRCQIVEECLIDYRQHRAQQLGERKLNLWAQYRRAMHMDASYFDAQQRAFESLQQRVMANQDRWIDTGFGKAIENKVEHCRSRVRLRSAGLFKWPLLMKEVCSGRYSRNSYGWKSVAQDVFL